MPIDPNIALSVKTPIPESPLQTIGGLMQLRDMSSQIALRNAQTLQAQQQSGDIAMQAQQRQRALADQATIQQAMGDPATARQLAAGDMTALQGKVMPTSLVTFQSGVTEHLTSLENLHKDALADRDKAYGRIEDTLNGLKAMTGDDGKLDLDQVNANLPSAIQQLTAQGIFKDAGLTAPPPTLITDPKQLDEWAATIGALQGANSKALALRQTASETSKNTAQAGQATAEANLATAKIPGATGEGSIDQMKADAMKRALAGQQNGQHPVDAILGQLDPTAAKAYHINYDAAMANGGPDAANKVLDSAAAHAAQISMASNPQVRAGEVAKQVAIDTATFPMKLQTAVAQARAMMGTGPTSNVPPHLAVPAINAFEKAGQDYAAALSSADEMKSLVELARGGNKVAYAYAPVTGVLTINTANGVKRVNMAEIESYGGAGSALDKIKGWFGKQVSGASIPDDVLNDIDSLHGQLAKNAGDTYSRKVQVVNGSYGSKFQPIQLTGGSQATAPATGVSVTAPDGSVHVFPDQASADQFKKLAGIR